jgi:hypothetical protein
MKVQAWSLLKAHDRLQLGDVLLSNKALLGP